MAEAVAGLVFFERAADVVFAVNDRPALVEADALEIGGHVLIAGVRRAAGGGFAAAADAGDRFAV